MLLQQANVHQKPSLFGHQGLLTDNEIILIRLDRLTVSRLRSNGRRLRVVRTDGNTMPIVCHIWNQCTF